MLQNVPAVPGHTSWTDRHPSGAPLPKPTHQDTPVDPPPSTGLVARLSVRLTAVAERWLPDAFIFALLFTFIAIAGALLATPATLNETVDAWGRGFWDLIPFTMQMALIVITGHVLASSPPVGRVIAVIAGWPRSPRGAVACVAVVAMPASWIHWGFSLMFSAMLARAIARRMDVDYRALGAASYLGLGTIWAQGLSGSAVLQMATPTGMQPQVREIVAHGGLVPGGVVSFAHTIFIWQNLALVGAEVMTATLVMWLATPPPNATRTARDLGVDLHDAPAGADVAHVSRTPGNWLEYSPVLNWLVLVLAVSYLVRYFAASADPVAAINLNTLNLVFLTGGFFLHRTPARLMSAVRAATPAVWGILLQFPFYAGIANIVTATHLNDRIAAAFISISTPESFPVVVAIYSAALGVFVPSGGSKWAIEAPYVIEAAHSLRVHLGWTINAYGFGEALANLVQPFFMLPILSVLGLAARELMGYTLLVFLAIAPVSLLLLWLFGTTLPYPL